MNTQRNGAEQIPVAQHPGKRANQNRQPRIWNDDSGLPMNQGNLPQHLHLRNRSVVLGQGIATRDPSRVALLDQTMDDEPPVPRDQHDVPRNDLLAGLVLYAENVAGPDRWKHAGSHCLQAYRATGVEHFGGKLPLMTLVCLCHNWHSLELRTLSIEAALKLGGTDFATRQGHGLENPLVPELGFLIRLLPRRTAVAYVLLIRIRVFLHKSPRVLDRAAGGQLA
jgi:hypothetical protein